MFISMLTKRLTNFVILFVSSVALTACLSGPGYHTKIINGVKTVSKTDDKGNSKDIYRVDKNGATTVFVEDDPMYQKHLAKQQYQQQHKQQKAAEVERIKNAAKRKKSDPIYVALGDLEISAELKKIIKDEGKLHKQIWGQIEKDNVIKLVKNKKSSRWQQLLNKQGRDSDVVVTTKVYLKEMVGINRNTKKLGKATALVMESTIKSNWLPDTYTVSEKGHLLKNVSVTKKLANKIKKIIKSKIGPTIPADRKNF